MNSFPLILSRRRLQLVAGVFVAVLSGTALAQAPIVRGDDDDVRVRADGTVREPAVRADRDVDVRVDRDVRVNRDVRADGTIRDVREIKGSDRNFIENAAREAMEHAEMARIAAERTSNPHVRRLARQIVDDHAMVREEITALAASRGVSLPAKDTGTNKWAKHDAKDFDKDFLEALIDEHEEQVRMFDKQARNGEDPAAVAFARKHLSKLQEHLYAALDLKRILRD